MTDTDANDAYAIDGPDGARALYGDWASTYDSGFGAARGYVLPREVASVYQAACRDDTPILDVGAGTGLVAEHLRGSTLDAIDITAEMLEIARAKQLYRDHILADVLQPLPMADETYGGIISAGTFTHGHVGPACLPELLRVSRPGALFVASTLPAVFDGMGFGSALATLNARGAISDLRFHDVPVYEGKRHPRAADRALIMVFRKL